MEPKYRVAAFYNSDFYKMPETLNEYLHPEVELLWNSSTGFHKFNYSEIGKISQELNSAFESLRADISHLICENNTVAIRFTYYVGTVENPDEELPMAHFIAIWELKDGKLFKGHQISQQADDSPENLESFLPFNS